ncbi:MAG TPA: hypothetical protein VF310_02700 [Vicinamibacteria bacterium]
MRPRTLSLTAARRRALEQVRDRDHRPSLRERAAAALKVADGETIPQVAARGLHRPRTPKTVRGWLNADAAGGAAGLVQRPRGHRGFPPSAGRAAGGDGAAAA